MVKSAATQGPEQAATGDDRRKHLRVHAPLKARYMDQYGDEHACLIMNISAGGALVRAKAPPPFGAEVVLYVDRVGRFDCRVIRSGSKSFAVAYEQKRRRNAKIADSLTRIVNQNRRGADRRANPRVAHDAPAKIIFEDGTAAECAILDISLTGASIEISPRPPLGARLILGRMSAKVVRRHEKGVGVVFTGTAERMSETIAETTSLEPPAPSGAPVASATFGRKHDKS